MPKPHREMTKAELVKWLNSVAGLLDEEGVMSRDDHATAQEIIRRLPDDAGVAVSDVELGCIWFNRLTRLERANWLARAGSAVPADAWEAFRREVAREPGEEVNRT